MKQISSGEHQHPLMEEQCPRKPVLPCVSTRVIGRPQLHANAEYECERNMGVESVPLPQSSHVWTTYVSMFVLLKKKTHITFKLLILLPLLRECWGYRCVPPGLACNSFFFSPIIFPFPCFFGMSLKQSFILFHVSHVYLSICVCNTCMCEPEHIRKEHWIPWNWRHRWL